MRPAYLGEVPLLDLAAMQVGLDLQPRSAAEARTIDLQILHDPLHVISCLGKGDQFYPVDASTLGSRGSP